MVRMMGRPTIMGGCCTRWMLYLVYAVLGVCCTLCQLMIIAWRDTDEWLSFYSAIMVVLRTSRWDGGWRWEQYAGYERICEISGTTCRIEFGRPGLSVLTFRIGSSTCRIGNAPLTHAWNSLHFQFLMLVSPISCHLSRSHPQLYYHLSTWSYVIPRYLSRPWSWVNTEYSIQQVPHRPIINCLLLRASLSSLGGPSCTPPSTFLRSWVWPMKRFSALFHAFLPIYRLKIDHLQVFLHSRSTMALKCISKLTRSWPPSLHDDGLQVSLHTRSIIASKFAQSIASKLDWLRPPSASLCSLYVMHLVHEQTRFITASKCISQFTQSQSPSASPYSLDHGLQVHTINVLQSLSFTATKCISQFTRSRDVSALPNSLYHGLQVNLSVHTILAAKCISTLAWSLNRSTSQSFHHHSLPVHLKVLWLGISGCCSDYTWEPVSSQIGRMYIYRET